MASRRNNRPAAPAAPAVDQAAVDRTLSELRSKLERSGRRDVAAHIQRELGGDVPCYGIKAAETHSIGLEVVRRLRSGGMPLTMAISEQLFKSAKLEEGLIGAQLVGALARHISGSDFDRYDAWAASLNNAQTADALAMQCISRAMAAKPSIALRLIDWAKSPSPWRRRAAAMSFAPLVREGRFMTDALTVADVIMADPDEDVQKGVGTLLMEATRLKAPRVMEFLVPWKGRAARMVMQTAATKLSREDRAAVLD
jgi:3-methyladenine DNA glycosylase AlkD